MQVELTLLREIVKTQNENIFLKLVEDYFIFNKSKNLFKFIRNYYVKYNRLPDLDVIKLEFSETIFDNLPNITDILFLYNYVVDRYRRHYYFENLYDIIENTEDFNELIIKNQELLLNLIRVDEDNEEITFSEVNDDTKEILYPLGLGLFDKVLGGIANSETFIVGGYRGAGKSLVLLNIALNNYINNHETTLFFSIEMRGKEVINRIDSILTGIDGLRIKKGELSTNEKLKIYKTRAKVFKDEWESVQDINDLEDLKKVYSKLPDKRHRFVLLDTPMLTPSKIIYYLKKYTNTGMVVIDYLNILRTITNESQLSWISQLEKANELKSIARQFNVKMVSAVQIDEEGKIRFSKGIADPVDYLFSFFRDNSILRFKTLKVRNGIPCDFSMKLDGLKLVPLEGVNNE